MKIKKTIVPWQKINDEIVILIPDNNEAIELNSMGSDIWKIIDNGLISANELIQTLLSQYEVTKEQIELDVQDFLTELEAKKLISYVVS